LTRHRNDRQFFLLALAQEHRIDQLLGVQRGFGNEVSESLRATIATGAVSNIHRPVFADSAAK
jgi:hypothetical protein